MGTSPHIDPPFGEYALPPKREALRMAANHIRGSRVGRWRISYHRKRAIRGRIEPFDVDVAPHVKARLYPSNNRCEKRALCGVQIWDPDERDALKAAISRPSDTPFVFLDVGANIGLYSLFAHSYARQAGRSIRILAVEPSADIGQRLSVNAAASKADIELRRTAISTEAGDVFLSDGGENRGEGQIAPSGESVPAVTLLQFCAQNDVTRLDALKLDIEGMDLAVLTQFFEQASETLHPKMMILETDETTVQPLIELTQAHNYLIRTRTRMNIVVAKRDQT